MNEIVLKVGPAASGWALDCAELQSTYFRSGARAEAAARRLAILFSGAGRDVRMVVHDSMERSVATHHYFAS